MRLDLFGTRSSNSVFGGITVVILAGCGNVQSVDTLDGLMTSSGFDGTYRKPINLNYPAQTRFLASNGLLPINGPGDTCLSSNFRPASGILCFSPSGKNEVSVRRFKFSGGYEDLQTMRDKLQKLQVNIIELAALDASTPQEEETPQEKSDIESKSSELEQNVEKFGEELRENNFFVFRWQAESQAGAGGNVGSPLSGRAGRQQQESGLVIVGGLTVSSLRLGLDDDAKQELKAYPKSTKIATYTMGAEHLLYFSGASLSAALSAKLDGSLETIKDISPSTKAVIDAYASLGRASEIQGAFSATSVESLSLARYNEKYGTQHVFYSTMTDVETLLDSIGD
jgi:hypothetical protein